MGRPSWPSLGYAMVAELGMVHKPPAPGAHARAGENEKIGAPPRPPLVCLELTTVAELKQKIIKVGSSCNLITVFMWRGTPLSLYSSLMGRCIFVAKSFLESCGVACHFLQSCDLPKPDVAICARQLGIMSSRFGAPK